MIDRQLSCGGRASKLASVASHCLLVPAGSPASTSLGAEGVAGWRIYCIPVGVRFAACLLEREHLLLTLQRNGTGYTGAELHLMPVWSNPAADGLQMIFMLGQMYPREHTLDCYYAPTPQPATHNSWIADCAASCVTACLKVTP